MKVMKFLPGVLLSVVIAAIARWIENLMPVHVIGGAVIAMFLGMTVNYFWGTPAALAAGTKFTSKKVLKLAIILLGLSLNINTILNVGKLSLVVMVFTLATCFGGGYFIGKALGLNLDLIEAIALGHDIGHTPFGHAGEELLDELFFEHTGLHFSHNIHSVRVLDKIFPYNISLQTLNGIAAHDGEMELCEYNPKPITSFEEFDKQIEGCYIDKKNIRKQSSK